MNKKLHPFVLSVSLLVFSLVIIPGAVFSQSSGWQWAKSAGGSLGNEGFSIAALQNGDVYVTGYFSSPSLTFGSITILSNNGVDIFLAKYDANGNVLWAKSIGGLSNDYGYSVAADPVGNAYITGGFTSPTINFGSYILSKDTTNSNSTSDLFIAKFDPAGNVLWARSAVGTEQEQSFSIACDANGNSFITGYFLSPFLVFGPDTIMKIGGADIFLAKYDTGGNVLWAKRAGGNTSAIAYTTAADAGGNVYITGGFTSIKCIFGTDTVTNTAFNTTDVFLAKYDANGNSVWAKSGGGTGYDEGYSTTSDPGGNTYITGYFISPTITFGGFTLNNPVPAKPDIFLVKYDPNGNVLWAKSAGGNDDDKGCCVTTDNTGTVYLTGMFSSPSITINSTTLTAPANSNDPMFFAIFDSTGNLDCAVALASGGDDLNSVSTDAFGNAYIGGDFYNINPFIVGNDSLYSLGTEDIFVAKYNCNTTGIQPGPSLPAKNEMSIYPDPADSRVTLKFVSDKNYECELRITDVTRREIMQVPILAAEGINEFNFDIHNLAKGLYLVKLKMGDGEMVKRLLKK